MGQLFFVGCRDSPVQVQASPTFSHHPDLDSGFAFSPVGNGRHTARISNPCLCSPASDDVRLSLSLAIPIITKKVGGYGKWEGVTLHGLDGDDRSISAMALILNRMRPISNRNYAG